MATFTDIATGKTPAAAIDIQQVINALSARANIPLATTVTDPLNYAVTLKNTDPGSKGIIVYAADGTTVLFQVDSTGVKLSPDGTPATGQVVNLTAIQTLANKTLTSPILTTPVVSGGGLRVVAGNVGIGAAPQTWIGLDIPVGTNLTAVGSGVGIRSSPTLSAAANSDALYGLIVGPAFADNAHTAVSHTSINVAAPATSSTTAANIGIDVSAPSGSSLLNAGIRCAGGIVLTGAFSTGLGIQLNSAGFLYSGSGLPSNAQGTNGDIYFRTDGGAGTTIYQRRAGLWVATGA